MKQPSVAVCIPSIPPRKRQLARAVSSVLNQDYPIAQIVVSFDNERLGAAANRNKTWLAAQTDFVAFLDDDDELDRDHVSSLVQRQQETGADLVFPWHRIVRYEKERAPDILGCRGIADEAIIPRLRQSNFIPINVLVRTSALEAVGGFPIPNTVSWPHDDCEDWGCWLRLADAGYKFSHLDKETWTWHHWGWGTPHDPGNTSGKADRW